MKNRGPRIYSTLLLVRSLHVLTVCSPCCFYSVMTSHSVKLRNTAGIPMKKDICQRLSKNRHATRPRYNGARPLLNHVRKNDLVPSQLGSGPTGRAPGGRGVELMVSQTETTDGCEVWKEKREYVKGSECAEGMGLRAEDQNWLMGKRRALRNPSGVEILHLGACALSRP